MCVCVCACVYVCVRLFVARGAVCVVGCASVRSFVRVTYWPASLVVPTSAASFADGARADGLHRDRVTAAEQAVLDGAAGGYDAGVWHDYAAFLLRAGNTSKAAECLRECVAADRFRTPSLLALGAVQAARGDNSRAVVFVRGALRVLVPVRPIWGDPTPPADVPPASAYLASSSNDTALAYALLANALDAAGVCGAARLDMRLVMMAASGMDARCLSFILHAAGDERAGSAVTDGVEALKTAGHTVPTAYTVCCARCSCPRICPARKFVRPHVHA